MAEQTGAAWVREFAGRWEDAWNSHRTDDVMALLHPEIEWDDRIFWTDVLHGHDEVRTYVDTIWEVMPDVRFEEVQLFTGGPEHGGVYLFRQTASAPARFETDKVAVTHGSDIFLEFRDGLLLRYMAQYEISEMMRQFGVLPPRGGRIGGAYLLSLLHRRA